MNTLVSFILKVDLYSLDVFKNNIFKETNSIKTLAKNSYKINYVTINKDSNNIEIIEENLE